MLKDIDYYYLAGEVYKTGRKKYDIIIKKEEENNEKSYKNRVNYNGNNVYAARCNALV